MHATNDLAANCMRIAQLTLLVVELYQIAVRLPDDAFLLGKRNGPGFSLRCKERRVLRFVEASMRVAQTHRRRDVEIRCRSVSLCLEEVESVNLSLDKAE